MAWIIDKENHVTLLDVCGKAFKEKLESLPGGKTNCLNFDEIVKHHVTGDRPSSTDALVETKDSILFIEFKGGDDPPSDGSDLETPKSKTCGLKCKASDAALLYHSFLNEIKPGHPKLTLIVVSDSGYDEIRRKIRPVSTRTPFCPDFLKMYMNRDNNGNRIFYDEVRWCTPEELCEILNNEDSEVREDH